MALKRDAGGMAVLVDAMIFLVALTLLSAMIFSTGHEDAPDGKMELLRSYHMVMLTGEPPWSDGGSIFAGTLADYLMVLALCGLPPTQEQIGAVGEMVNGTISEVGATMGIAWLVIEIGPFTLLYGPVPPGEGGDRYADRRELGDGRVVSTLFMAG